jgi:spore germination protein
MKRSFLALLCLTFMMTGCAQKRIIDDLALMNAIAYDISDNEQEPLKSIATFPIITKDGNYDRETLIATGKSIKDAREKYRTETNLQLESGQLRVAIFGADLAREGVMPFIDTFVRDPDIGIRVMLGIAEDKASDIITLKIENEGQNATYLEQFITKIHKETKRVNYTIYQFLRDLYDDGIDPILPVFKEEEKKIKFSGMGVFKEDKLIEIINPKDSQILFLLKKNIKHGTYGVELDQDKKEFIVFNFTSTKNRVHVNSVSKGKPSVNLEVEVLCEILEYTGEKDLSDPVIQKKLEKFLSGQISKKMNELVGTFQDLKVDPIGIGSHIRNHMKYDQWKKLDWYEMYSHMDINIKPSVKISSSGKWK